MDTDPKSAIGGWLRSRTGLVFFAFLAIAAFYLVTEHTAHIFGILPYALLLLCPLLHLFMHRGHGENAELQEHAGQRWRGDSVEPQDQRLQRGKR